MTEKLTKWFVVRQSANLKFAFEFLDRDPKNNDSLKGEYLSPVIYSTPAIDGISLSAAINLYRQGIRVKPQDEKKRKLKPLAEILRIKAEKKTLAGPRGVIYDTEDYYEPA